MANQLNPVRGTHDLFGEAQRLHRYVCDTARERAACFGYEEVSPPIFELSEVFHRTLGDTSDVVSKETYTFDDRGGESITLRPEFTASIVRGFISNGLTQQLPYKSFYAGPAFRYERPQKGRLRQFHQIGIEVLGADQPWHDVEVIDCSAEVLRALGLLEHVTLEINSLGDVASRTAYREMLVSYFRDHKDSLSEESRERLERNPLRILDSKQESDRQIVADAPDMQSCFTDEAKAWFEKVKLGLDALQISYMVSPRLVRGLDYYTHTVFEWTTDVLGAQNTVLAGGRYDGLVQQMGGPDIPGIGWAAGVERLSLAMQECHAAAVPGTAVPVVVVPMGEAAVITALSVAHQLRQQGVRAEMIQHKNVGKAMKKADTLGAQIAVLIGDDEMKQGLLTLKDLSSGTQESIAQDALLGYVTQMA